MMLVQLKNFLLKHTCNSVTFFEYWKQPGCAAPLHKDVLSLYTGGGVWIR